MKKWIRRIILAVVVLLIAAVAITWAMLDTLARKGIEKGGEFAPGVPTNVNQVQLSPLKGTLMIDNLKVDNPHGFSSPHVLKTGRFELEVRPMSFVNGPVDVRKFVLDGLDVNIDQLLKGNNVSVLMDHIKMLGGANAEPKDRPKDQGEGAKILVGTLVIKNVVAHIHLPTGGPAGDLTIRLPAIEMTDVTKDAPEGVTVGGLVKRIVPAIFASIIEKGKGLIPADLAGVLNRDVAGAAQAVGGQAVKMVQQVGGEAAKQAMQIADDAAKRTQQDAEKAAKEIQKGASSGLKDILGGSKSKTPPDPNK